jgi:hypothetical protein
MSNVLDDDDLFITHMLSEIEPEMTDELAAQEAIAEHRTEMQQQRMRGASWNYQN